MYLLQRLTCLWTKKNWKIVTYGTFVTHMVMGNICTRFSHDTLLEQCYKYQVMGNCSPNDETFDSRDLSLKKCKFWNMELLGAFRELLLRQVKRDITSDWKKIFAKFKQIQKLETPYFSFIRVIVLYLKDKNLFKMQLSCGIAQMLDYTKF